MHAVETDAALGNEEDDVARAPRSAARSGGWTERSHSASAQVHGPQLIVGEEAERETVRRPERVVRVPRVGEPPRPSESSERMTSSVLTIASRATATCRPSAEIAKCVPEPAQSSPSAGNSVAMTGPGQLRSRLASTDCDLR